MEHKTRIETLDSFRAIAIIMVLFYHFYSRWTPPLAPVNYYPYDGQLAAYFKYGFFGVNFFFIISGFVIFYTLEKSKTVIDFLLKRFIRLLPPMLICSLITYFFIKAFDKENRFSEFHSNTPLDFFPSLTFTHPIFWVKLFHRADINYINGSYWSLWVEVTFYLISSVMFFSNKEKFARNWMLLLLPATILKIVSMPEYANIFAGLPQLGKMVNVFKWVDVYLNICNYFVYFSLGILYYCLFFGKSIPGASKYICIFFTVIEFYILPDNGMRVLLLIIIIIFLLFLYRPGWLAFMNSALITRIGVISYTVYLIHENIGVVLINKLGSFTNSAIAVKLIPLLVIVTFIVFADILYRVYEKPVTNFLRKKLVRR